MTSLHRQRLESLDYCLVKLYDHGPIMVEIIPQRDGQTDGHTMMIRIIVLSRGDKR